MLYQVPDRDSSFLRFFCWEDGNLERELQECQMVVHLFGAISSPACANFAYNKEDFPSDVISTLKRNFYVDDCLKSLTLKTKATARVDSSRNLLSRGGFRLTKWVSNSREVLEAIPKVERSKEVRKLGARKDEPHVQRAFGVQWCTESDTFGFNVCIKPRPPTRRGIMSMASTVFDPLVFLAPFVLTVKQILQDLSCIKPVWDDEIPPVYGLRWKNWLLDLPKLSSFAFNRCLKTADFGQVKSSQLHHFSDVSEVAYGSVAYLRLVSDEGKIHCSFLF